MYIPGLNKMESLFSACYDPSRDLDQSFSFGVKLILKLELWQDQTNKQKP